MTEKEGRWQEELDGLRQMRDELRLQVELGRAEARDAWEGLEKRWQHLEGRTKQLRDSSREDLAEIREAASLLMEEIREGYRHLRKKA